MKIILDISSLDQSLISKTLATTLPFDSSLSIINPQTDTRLIVLDLCSTSTPTLQLFLDALTPKESKELKAIQVLSTPELVGSSTAILSSFIDSIPYANKRLFIVLGAAAQNKKAFLVDSNKDLMTVAFDRLFDPVDVLSLGFGSILGFKAELDDPEPERDPNDPYVDFDLEDDDDDYVQ
jgi:hypothetical protein